MFELKPSDGAIGGHTAAVQECYRVFHRLAEQIAKACEVKLPNLELATNS